MKISYIDENKKGTKEIGENVKQFAYDGCHKIYLIENEENLKSAKASGYDIYPIEELENKFNHSCGMRFINTWDLETIVPQFAEDVKFGMGV